MGLGERYWKWCIAPTASSSMGVAARPDMERGRREAEYREWEMARRMQMMEIENAQLRDTVQESIDELKHKLLCTTFELETIRTEAQAEMRKSKENINQLLQLLAVARQERDEARDQLQKLNQALPSASAKASRLLPHTPSESLPPRPPRASSSIPSGLPETYNPHSYVSSPPNCFFNSVSSSNFSNKNTMSKLPFGSEYGNGSVPVSEDYSGKAIADRASATIDGIVKGKSLPEKGRLMQAVLEAGPLLETLILSGPLPQWRTPPTMQQKIPSIPIKAVDCYSRLDQKLAGDSSFMPQNPSVISCLGISDTSNYR
ncbi:uncharacterized protein LOC131160895 [Malania oleifera]|uniref:uncharacterized protein LOC131160895 n=1 Tax=Malania oleifera TaxID=397392 RepID=UPI0025AE36AC|nr:uncharacterized protein LOC131160895 [Malania oleifera]